VFVRASAELLLVIVIGVEGVGVRPAGAVIASEERGLRGGAADSSVRSLFGDEGSGDEHERLTVAVVGGDGGPARGEGEGWTREELLVSIVVVLWLGEGDRARMGGGRASRRSMSESHHEIYPFHTDLVR
jgi:hypothetical protein